MGSFDLRMRGALERGYHAVRAKVEAAVASAALPLVRPAFGTYPAVTREFPFPPVFILGLPRCGSTFLYQALTNCLDVAYIDNLACQWSGDLRVGMEFSRRVYKDQPHGTFESRLGTTRGGHAPSECGSFWYRWLPRDEHFVPASTRPVVSEEIRREVLAVSLKGKKPFLFKNLHMGQRLRLLHQAFPEARFVRIKRDSTDVVASILEARKSRNTPAGHFWSTRPPRWRSLANLPELDLVASQVVALERQMDHDLALYPASQQFVARFPGSVLDADEMRALEAFVGAKRRAGGDFPRPRKAGPREVNPLLEKEIAGALERAAASPLTEPMPFESQGARR
jgi:hypothetical protein